MAGVMFCVLAGALSVWAQDAVGGGGGCCHQGLTSDSGGLPGKQNDRLRWAVVSCARKVAASGEPPPRPVLEHEVNLYAARDRRQIRRERTAPDRAFPQVRGLPWKACQP